MAPSEDVVRSAERLRKTAKLGEGEAAAIALARNRYARCLTDDHAARTTAESRGIEVGGSNFVLLEARSTGILSGEAYADWINDLSDSGFRMCAPLYRRAIETGKNLDAGPDQQPPALADRIGIKSGDSQSPEYSRRTTITLVPNGQDVSTPTLTN